MPRQNATHTDGSGHLIHASDVAAPDLYLAQLSRQTYLVEEFGAKQDGVTDDTTAVQAALTAAGATGGRVVVTNPCRCAGQLTVPPYVFLDCGQAGPQRGPYGQGTTPNILGPSLLTTGNAGQTAASAAFLTLGRGAAFRGIILHPNQTQTNPPVQYPPAIVLANGGEGAILKDVLLVNPYIGVYSSGHGKPYIDGLYGQALNIGLYLDQCYDIARIRNVHWWNFWKAYVSTDPLETYQRQNLTAFYLGRVDGLHAENWLSYGHYIGLLLTQVANGPGSGAINKLWLDGGVHGVAATAVGYQGMTIRDSVIYSQFKDGSGNPGYAVLVSGNATALDRLTFDGYDFNLSTANNPSAVFVGSGVTGGRYTFRGGAFESYTSAAVVCRSTATSLSVRAASFRGSGAILDVSTLTSSATGVYEVADCEYNKPPTWALPATLPPGLSIDQNRAARSGVVTAFGSGAKGDGTTDDRAALAAADGRNGGASVTVLAPATYRVASNLTFANPVQFQPGATLSIDTGVTVTFSGKIIAGAWQIFSGSGTVAFGPNAIKRGASPEWWGVTGIGDQIAINKAIVAVGTGRGGIVHLMAKDYETLSPVVQGTDRASIRGCGRQATRIVNNSLTSDAVQISGVNSNVLLQDLEITGVQTGRTGGNALTVGNVGSGVVVERVSLNSHVDGVSVGASVYEPFFRQLLIGKCTGSAFHVDPGGGTTPVDVDLDTAFFSAPTGTTAIGINVAAASGIYVRNINITGPYQNAGLFRPTVAGQQNNWGIWQGCLFDAATASCFLVDSSSGLAASINSHTFTNCWFASGGIAGLEMNSNTGGLTVDGLDFIGCRFYHNQHEGVHGYGGPTQFKNITFTDCHVAKNSQASPGTYNGYLFEGNFSHWRIRGGHAGAEATGTYGGSSTQNFGLAVTSSGCTDFYVDGLDATGNLNAAGITVASGATSFWVKHCPSYNPRGVLGPPAVPASGTALTNPYGSDATVYLTGGTVSAISVGGSATGLTSTPATVRVPAKQSLTLTYTVAPSWVWAVE